ncbi:MAG: ester cyclase [Bacteroidetes bacterium]|nr:ester cyclase [Bacteroidota bacterium]
MHKKQVRKFYSVLWDAHDKEAIPSVLHKDVTFRGSLGLEKKGHSGFAEYVDLVHEALGDFRCIIEDLVSEEDRVFAKMTFSGIHQSELMGYPPTHQRVSWPGAALFTFKGDRVMEVWALGDRKTLEEQLKAHVS